jgi:hypothetical protein
MQQLDNIDLLNKSLCEDSYFEFFKLFWHTLETSRQLQLNWTHPFIANVFQEAAMSVINTKPKLHDVMTNLCPSQGKTRLCTELFVPWLLAKNPGLKIIIGSFTVDIANKFSGEIRKVMRSALYQKFFPETKLLEDSNRVSRFHTTMNGSVETVSPGSATTSRHADILILDDISSADQASSPTVNASIIQWYEESLQSRITSLTETVFFVIGQRYHNEDIFSHLLNKSGANYYHIVFPAMQSENILPSLYEIQQKYPEAYAGGTMDAVRLPLEKMDGLERSINPDVWENQYLQNPLDMRTVLFQKDWVEVIEQADGILLGKGKTRHIVIDSASSDKPGSDETAIGVFFNDDNGNLILENSHCVKYGWSKLVSYIYEIIARNKIGNKSKVLIENMSSGVQLIEEIRGRGYNAIAISHEGKGKEARMSDDNVLAPVMAKRFKMIRHQNLSKVLGQFCGPLKMRRDDARDMCVYAIKHLMKNGGGDGSYSFSILLPGGATRITTGKNTLDGNRFLNLPGSDKHYKNGLLI